MTLCLVSMLLSGNVGCLCISLLKQVCICTPLFLSKVAYFISVILFNIGNLNELRLRK